MANISPFDEQDGTERLVSDAPPAHYIVKIQTFSSLMKSNIDKYESAIFQAGGYKWKLIIHPNGNKAKNIKEHISAYLAMAETDSIPLSWEVHAVLRLFLLDQNKDNYLIVQDTTGKHRRLNWLKPECGFDRFIPLKTFIDSRSGYLVDDTCVLGVEVFVSKETSTWKGETLRMVKDATSSKHLWKIDNFSNLKEDYYDSTIFLAGNFNWKIRFYPNGKGTGLGSCISLYLNTADTLPAGSKLYAEFTLRIIDQLAGRNYSGKATHWFSDSSKEAGWARFMLLPNFKHLGALINDSCKVEAEVSVLGVVDSLP